MNALSKYFTYEEATYSDTAARLGIENKPNDTQLSNMIDAAKKLDLLREKVGPIQVTSWLRTPALNASIPGSSSTSHHTLGWAIDCKCNTMDVLKFCQTAKLLYLPLGFDQIIHEYGRWMHISFHPDNRRQTLTIFRNTLGYKYKLGLLSQSEYMKV